jgi:hypothetical protein
MADSLSISPVALSGPAGIFPVASALPETARFAEDSSLFAEERSVVDLSTEGQLLSALSSFRSALPPQPEATPVASETATPTPLPPDETIAATAQSLLDAINTLLASVSALPSGAVPPTADTISEQLLATLTALSTTPIAAADDALTLPAIGIAPPPASTGSPPLQLDQTLLAAAITSAPAATQAVLAEATEAVAAFAATAESQLATATTAPLPLADLNLLGTATPLAADPGILPALTPVPLPLPGAAAELPNAGIILPADAAILAALQAAGFAGAAETASVAAPLTTARTASPALPGLAPPLTGTANTPPTTSAAPPVPATAPVTITPAPAAVDVLAAEQRSTTASLALQTALAAPWLRALNNQADPAYAAVIAASHLSDFDSPRPFTDARTLASDTIGPVSALVRARAIADYREAAGEAEQRTLIGTSTTRQYWV